MPARRLTTEKQRQAIVDSKKYKGKKSNFTRQELDDIIIILAKKSNIIYNHA